MIKHTVQYDLLTLMGDDDLTGLLLWNPETERLCAPWRGAPVPQVCRHSPRHAARRSVRARVPPLEEKPSPLPEVPESDPESSASLRRRKVKKRVQPDFYQSIQVTPTRKPVGIPTTIVYFDTAAAIYMYQCCHNKVKCLTMCSFWTDMVIWTMLSSLTYR